MIDLDAKYNRSKRVDISKFNRRFAAPPPEAAKHEVSEFGIAPPNDLADGTRPELDGIAAFRIPGDCLIKLHVGTWHAGPHFVHNECLFFNLENLDTNERDFDTCDLPDEYQIQA